MNMIRIACIGIAGVVLALFLKQSRSPYAELISMAVCLLILFYSFGTLTGLFERFGRWNDPLQFRRAILGFC